MWWENGSPYDPDACNLFVDGDHIAVVWRPSPSAGWRGYACPGVEPHHIPVYTRRCDAKRAAEVLVGQWWREKCEREALAADYKARALSAFRGENHGTDTVDVMARAIAERVSAAQKSIDETMARIDPMRCPEGPDLYRLAALYGVWRCEPASPVQYTFLAEGAKKVAAAFRAIADAARGGAESVKGCYEVLNFRENEDTLRERMNAALAESRDLPVAEAFRGLPLVVTTIRECGPEGGE